MCRRLLLTFLVALPLVFIPFWFGIGCDSVLAAPGDSAASNTQNAPDKRDSWDRFETISRTLSIGDKVWGGAFWELREKLSNPKLADQLLAAAWVAWKPKDPKADLFAEFANQLLETDQQQNGGGHVEIIQAMLRKRGLEI